MQERKMLSKMNKPTVYSCQECGRVLRAIIPFKWAAVSEICECQCEVVGHLERRVSHKTRD